MRNHFPDPVEAARQAASKVGHVVRNTSGQGFIDSSVNKVTHGLVETGKQAILFPITTLVTPTVRTVNDLAGHAVNGALSLTWRALRNVPWIPVPGRTPAPGRPPVTGPEGVPLAREHDRPSPLSSTDRPGVGPGQNAGGPHPESRPA